MKGMAGMANTRQDNMAKTECHIEFDEPTHTYQLNGKPVPAVSKICELLQSFEGIPAAVLEEARVFGSYVHAACDYLNKDILDWDSLDPLLAAYVRGYQRFLLETQFVIEASEERVASLHYGYCGTLDLRGKLPKLKRPKKCVVDIKSTAALPRSVGPQTAAYKQAYEEMNDEKGYDRYCLHLSPDNYKFVPLHDGRGVQDLTTFVSAMNIWRWHNEV